MQETRGPSFEDMGLQNPSPENPSPDRAGLKKVSPGAAEVGGIMVGRKEAAAAELERAETQESARAAIRDFQITAERDIIVLRMALGKSEFDAKYNDVQSTLDQISATATQYNLEGEVNDTLNRMRGELDLLSGEHDAKMKLAA